VAQKPRDAVVNFFYRNLQRHRAVLPAIARLLLYSVLGLARFFHLHFSVVGLICFRPHFGL